MRSTALKKPSFFGGRYQVFEPCRLFHTKSSQQTFQFVTDIEGHLDYFKQQIRQSRVVKFIDSYESEITFIDPSSDDLFVCGGDVCDRGDDITVTNMLLNLKERFPERVTLILGNRDGNKTRFIYELPESPYFIFEDDVASVVKPAFASHSYKEYLTKQLMFRDADLQTCNKPVNRLKWILACSMGAPRAFEMRRRELARINRRDNISDEEVYRSFRQSVEPDGFMRKYLSHAQVGAIIGDTIIVHGGITPLNMGMIPDEFKAFADSAENKLDVLYQVSEPKKWVDELNNWYQLALKRWHDDKSQIKNYQYSNNSPVSPILHLTSGPGSKFKGRLPVVSNFLNQRRTLSPPDKCVVKFLQSGGINRVLTGHQPHGDTPCLLIGESSCNDNQDSIHVITCDTLYGNRFAYDKRHGPYQSAHDPRGSSFGTVHVSYDKSTKSSKTIFHGKDGFNEAYQFEISYPKKQTEDQLIGKTIEIDGQEYLVRVNSSGKDHYVLSYLQGEYSVFYRRIAKDELMQSDSASICRHE